MAYNRDKSWNRVLLSKPPPQLPPLQAYSTEDEANTQTEKSSRSVSPLAVPVAPLGDLPEITEDDLYTDWSTNGSIHPYLPDTDSSDEEIHKTTEEMIQEITEVTDDVETDRINLYRALTFMSAKISTTEETRNSDFPFISEKTFRGKPKDT